MWHYYRHLIILVIGFRCSTQATHFTAPFTPHMALLGFMCPGLGKLIRSQVLSHHTINKPRDTLPLSHSPSPDQLPLLCTPLVFSTYHALYGTCAAMSAPTITFVLISPVHKDKKRWTEYTHLMHLTLHLLPHTHACTLHCAYACISPPLLSYLFTYLALLSGCIQLDSALFHLFSPTITRSEEHTSELQSPC